MNVRRERFIKIAEKRINRILEDFRLFGNCSNKGNYEYTQEEISAMLNDDGAKKEFKFDDIQRHN